MPAAHTNLSATEQILIDDIVDYYRDLVRLGQDSAAMREPGVAALPRFNDVYTGQIDAIYKQKPLRALEAQTWLGGVICQPFIFGEGEVDWEGADELKERLDKLLKDKEGQRFAHHPHRSSLRRPVHLSAETGSSALLVALGDPARRGLEAIELRHLWIGMK
uniref:Uncharacterized protein n=1 Tax=Candidatus Kentrum sp. TC TaxID=2126339 RepID=A0A450YUI1_9GAMM|nr:MAG: hypothetical protein BECKTC1821E_GA0114239_104410 [Candidatus Kentron sp. TC]